MMLVFCSRADNYGLEYDLGKDITNIVSERISANGFTTENVLILVSQTPDTLILSIMDKRKVESRLAYIYNNSERYIYLKGKKVPLLSNEDLLYVKQNSIRQSETNTVQPPWSGNELRLYFDEKQKLIMEIKGE